MIRELDTINICVPTPLRKTKDPDMSYIVSACERLGLGTDRAFIEAQRLPPDMQDDISVAVSVYRQFKAHTN